MKKLKFATFLGGSLLLSLLTLLSTASRGNEIESNAAEKSPVMIGFEGALPAFRTIKIENEHVYDYTFKKAPVDWWVQSGKWGMVSPWQTAPGWSWFGGRSEEVGAVWNKRKFSGDFSFQFYFGFIQGVNGAGSKWPEQNSDVAFTFCGDGKNLGSGYSFILGANDNQRTILLRRGEQVAESLAAEALFATLADGRTTSLPISGLSASAQPSGGSSGPGVANRRAGSRQPGQSIPVTNQKLWWQSRWWHAKINKIGPRIECWLDNKMLFTYDDPQPLDSGQFALWFYNTGIVVSRAQIFYEAEVKSGSESVSGSAEVAPTLLKEKDVKVEN